MLRIPFEWLEFAFECFKFGSNGSKLHPFQMVRIAIRISFEEFELSFEWLESLLNFIKYAFECFESSSKGSNLDSDG